MLTATVLAVGSAFVHAAWNLLIKTSDDRALAAWGQFLAAGLISVVGLAVVGAPGWGALPYLAATGVVHVLYVEGLVAAYTHGDFSLSYPLARGGGAVLAAVGSVLFLGDRLSPAAWAAIAVAGVGLLTLRGGRGVPDVDDVILGSGADPSAGGPARGAHPPSRAPSAYALVTAACIATYTLRRLGGVPGLGRRGGLRLRVGGRRRPGHHRRQPGPTGPTGPVPRCCGRGGDATWPAAWAPPSPTPWCWWRSARRRSGT